MLPAFIHASVGLLAFILLREALARFVTWNDRSFFPWVPQIDYGICMVLPLTILLAWWFTRKMEPARVNAVKFGLLSGAGASAAALLLAALVFVGALLRQPLGLFPMQGLFILWIFVGIWFGAAIALCATLGSLTGVFAAKAVARLAYETFPQGVCAGWVATAISLALATVAVAGQASEGIGLIDRVTRYNRLAAFPARISVELIVRGESVKFERVVTCRRPISVKEAAQAKQARLPKPYWLPNNKSFGHVLSDGSAVFLITPDACRQMAQTRDEESLLPARNMLPANYRPLIGWTPDAATMESFDLYIDGTAYGRSDAPVRIVSMEMSYAPDAEIVSGLDQFAFIGWRAFPHLGEYGTYFATPLAPDTWMKSSLPSKELALLASPEFVFGLKEERNDPKGSSQYADLYDWDGTYIARNGTGIPDEPSANGSDFGRHVQPLSRPVFPLRRESDRWRLSNSEPGVLAFYRGLRIEVWPPKYPTPIAIGEKLAKGDDRQTRDFLYDPQSRLLYRINFEDFNLAKPDGVFASW